MHKRNPVGAYLSERERARLAIWQDRASRCSSRRAVIAGLIIGTIAAIKAASIIF